MLNITYYTDPLCCWSWGFEPQWRRLLFEYEGSIEWTYCMGGLIPAWDSFNDATNSVSRPIQMGPVWMHAAQISGMPMNTLTWMKDPPASSYPACIAVKCAMLQSKEAGEIYLRLSREAIMLDGRNIAKPDILFAIADELSSQWPHLLDLAKFRDDFTNGNGIEAFRQDMNQVRLLNINRFPTLVIKGAGKSAIMVTGYRTYDSLIAAIKNLAPGLEKTTDTYSPGEYQARWPNATPRELDEVFANPIPNE